MNNSTVTIFGHTFEHIALAEPFGSRAYRVTTEEGWYIHTDRMEPLTYKTVTFLYEDDNLDNVVIIAAADLPEDADICGGGDNDNDHEIA